MYVYVGVKGEIAEDLPTSIRPSIRQLQISYLLTKLNVISTIPKNLTWKYIHCIGNITYSECHFLKFTDTRSDLSVQRTSTLPGCNNIFLNNDVSQANFRFEKFSLTTFWSLDLKVFLSAHINRCENFPKFTMTNLLFQELPVSFSVMEFIRENLHIFTTTDWIDYWKKNWTFSLVSIWSGQRQLSFSGEMLCEHQGKNLQLHYC